MTNKLSREQLREIDLVDLIHAYVPNDQEDMGGWMKLNQQIHEAVYALGRLCAGIGTNPHGSLGSLYQAMSKGFTTMQQEREQIEQAAKERQGSTLQ